MQTIYEHAFLPGVAVDKPSGIIKIFRNAELLGKFGFYYMEEDEIEDAILFRATELTGLSFVNPELVRCYACVDWNGLKTFRYDPEEYLFVKI